MNPREQFEKETGEPYTLWWWLKMHGQAFSIAQWWKSNKKDMTQCMRYINLAVWIEARILQKVKQRNAGLVEFMDGIVSASSGKWEMNREDFNEEFVVWAKSVAGSKLKQELERNGEQI